jgi:hypothetical protein
MGIIYKNVFMCFEELEEAHYTCAKHTFTLTFPPATEFPSWCEWLTLGSAIILDEVKRQFEISSNTYVKMKIIADDNIPAVIKYQMIDDIKPEILAEKLKNFPKCDDMTKVEIVIKIKKLVSE